MRFIVDHAKVGTATCKPCKEKLAKGSLRIGKISPSPFNEDSDMKSWFHPKCAFDQMTGKRIKEENRIQSLDQIEEFDSDGITEEDRELIEKLFEDYKITLANADKEPSKGKKKKADSKPVVDPIDKSEHADVEDAEGEEVKAKEPSQTRKKKADSKPVVEANDSSDNAEVDQAEVEAKKAKKAPAAKGSRKVASAKGGAKNSQPKDEDVDVPVARPARATAGSKKSQSKMAEKNAEPSSDDESQSDKDDDDDFSPEKVVSKRSAATKKAPAKKVHKTKNTKEIESKGELLDDGDGHEMVTNEEVVEKAPKKKAPAKKKGRQVS